MDDFRLSIKNLRKSFAAPVLRRINLRVSRGEIHAIVGENGAGKTTLVNILTGLVAKDGGEIRLDGALYEPRRAQDGFAAGISFAAQELSTIATLSVAENMLLRHLPGRNGVIDRRTLGRHAVDMLERVGLDGVMPDTPAAALSLAERQLLELAKALSVDCRLLILDEPTAALAGPQAEHIHGIVTKLAANGTSIIYISHRLGDILQLADVVSVLRDGQVVASATAATLTVSELIGFMTGRSKARACTAPASATTKTPAIEVQDVVTAELPHTINFTAARGEVVGIAGLAGAGKSELLQALFGLVPLRGGQVRIARDRQRIVIRDAPHAVASGMGFLGEDRKSMGIFPGQSVLANMMVPGTAGRSTPFGLTEQTAEKKAGSKLRSELSIRCDSLDQDIGQLSGGNQQKALLARWLYVDSEVLLLDEPTRGVDMSTKNAIYALFAELRRQGKSIIIASSEIEELTTVCNRILVLSRRKLVRQFERGEWSEADILQAAFQEFGAARVSRQSAQSSGDVRR